MYIEAIISKSESFSFTPRKTHKYNACQESLFMKVKCNLIQFCACHIYPAMFYTSNSQPLYVFLPIDAGSKLQPWFYVRNQAALTHDI